MNHMGNQLMLLENDNPTQPYGNQHNNLHDDDNYKQPNTVTGTHDPFRNTRHGKPIEVQNKYHLLTNEDDDDNDSDSDGEQQDKCNGCKRKTKTFHPNKRQRKRLQLINISQQHKQTGQSMADVPGRGACADRSSHMCRLCLSICPGLTPVHATIVAST